MALRLSPLVLLAGCSHAPAFNVLGSFFPGWIACIAAGILLTLLLHWALRRAGLERDLRALPVVYLCSTLIFSSLLWLLLFE
jgi:hypothetical protein